MAEAFKQWRKYPGLPWYALISNLISKPWELRQAFLFLEPYGSRIGLWLCVVNPKLWAHEKLDNKSLSLMCHNGAENDVVMLITRIVASRYA